MKKSLKQVRVSGKEANKEIPLYFVSKTKFREDIGKEKHSIQHLISENCYILS